MEEGERFCGADGIVLPKEIPPQHSTQLGLGSKGYSTPTPSLQPQLSCLEVKPAELPSTQHSSDPGSPGGLGVKYIQSYSSLDFPAFR